MPWYLGSSAQFRFGVPGFLILLIIWSAVWAGLALWNAAKRGEKWWFIAFLVVHTAGILEILYLIFVAKIFTSGKPKKVLQKSRKR